MRKILALLALLALVSPAEAQKTKAAITTEINSFFADNTSGQITPAKLRTVTTDIVNSYVDWLACTGTGGLVYWSAGTPTCLSAGTAGQLLFTNGGSAAPSWVNATGLVSAGTGISITGTSPAVINIANQLAAGGPIGSATVTPVITYNAQGQLTAVSSVTIAPPFSAVTGIAAMTQGGTGSNLTASSGGIVYTDASVMQVLAGTASANRPLVSGSSAAPSWGSYSLPTSVNSGGVPYFSSTSAMLSSATLTANQIMIGGGAGAAPTTFACATSTTLVHGGTPPTCSQLAYADIVSSALATATEYYSATASKLVAASVVYPTEVTITYGATTTIDFDTLINGAVTLTGNITTLTLSNVRAGKAGQIRFIQDATGSRTWPAGGNTVLKYAGGTLPSLSTGANAVDVLAYSCSTATFCTASLLKDVRNP